MTRTIGPLTPELTNALYQEIVYKDQLLILDDQYTNVITYLKQYYGIFVKNNTLTFYARTTTRTRVNRRRFLDTYSSKINHVSLPPLHSIPITDEDLNIFKIDVLDSESMSGFYAHLVFPDAKCRDLFKLKYSEYL